MVDDDPSAFIGGVLRFIPIVADLISNVLKDTKHVVADRCFNA